MWPRAANKAAELINRWRAALMEGRGKGALSRHCDPGPWARIAAAPGKLFVNKCLSLAINCAEKHRGLDAAYERKRACFHTLVWFLDVAGSVIDIHTLSLTQSLSFKCPTQGAKFRA